MGDTLTFGVTLAVAAACLALAAVFQWAPYFSSRFDWTDYTILPLYLSGVAGLMVADLHGYSIGKFINDGLGKIQSGINSLVPGLAWIIFIVVALLASIWAIGYMAKPAEAQKKGKKPAIVVGLLPVTLSMIPAPLGPFLIAVVALVVTAITLPVRLLMGM